MRPLDSRARAAYARATIRTVVAIGVLAVLVVGILVFVEETLRLGDDAATVFSLLTATFATGTALGALVARSVEKRIGRTRLMAIGYLAPLMLVPAGITPPLPVLFACLFILGFTDAWAVIEALSPVPQIPRRFPQPNRARRRDLNRLVDRVVDHAAEEEPGRVRSLSRERQRSDSSGGLRRTLVPRQRSPWSAPWSDSAGLSCWWPPGPSPRCAVRPRLARDRVVVCERHRRPHGDALGGRYCCIQT